MCTGNSGLEANNGWEIDLLTTLHSLNEWSFNSEHETMIRLANPGFQWAPGVINIIIIIIIIIIIKFEAMNLYNGNKN